VLVVAGVLGTACMVALTAIPAVRNLPGPVPEPDCPQPQPKEALAQSGGGHG
jgi:hypothetical protein